MLIAYSLMWRLALPFVLLRLWLRGRREPGYRRHWNERLGFYKGPGSAVPTVWVHAVSVGETRAAEPLIDALLAQDPSCRIVLTHMTPTGRATGQALFAKHGARLVQSYLPYDTGSMVKRFIRHFSPTICLLMETEVWPNLIAACRAQGVPVALVNARLSERSLRRARQLGGLIRDAAQGIALVAVQTEMDAARVRQLGVSNVVVTGSIKFDVVVPQDRRMLGARLRERIGARPVLLCASTREGEEEVILDAFLRHRASLGEALLLLVPRHPQRFTLVAAMAEARGLGVRRRSALTLDDGAIDTLAAGVDVMLGDSMGEMFAYYAACDCAFIGGSLMPLGGQNLIEACALGKPVLIGPHTFNFAVASEEAIAAGAALRVADADALMTQAARLLRDDAARTQMGAQALAWTGLHRGATQRTLALLPALIK
jgi:3-deoxy-D-manno-octulosonic-acid transferase